VLLAQLCGLLIVAHRRARPLCWARWTAKKGEGAAPVAAEEAAAA